MSLQKSRPWKTVTPGELRGVRGVCLDIDDTLSTSGKLTAEAFQALWELKKAGFLVIPITGRPAGWCDLIARFWPVDAVVGENGAFTFFMQNGVLRRMDTPAGEETRVLRQKLHSLGQKVRERFAHVRWASDQSYREFDLAIDICEDVPPWNREDVDSLLSLCRAEGAHAKLSSIHVNTWFGDYDKKRGLEHWLSQGAPGVTSARVPHWDELIYIGDSPNDEPMFASFRLSVGVANLRKYLDRIHSQPVWITENESGAGFAEMAQRLISIQ